MDEFMTGGVQIGRSSKSSMEMRQSHNDSGEFPDLLDSGNSLATLNSDFSYSSYVPSDDKLDSFLKSAEGIKMESGLTFTNLNGLKPEYPDIDISSFEGLHPAPTEQVVIAKRSVVQVSEVKSELEFEVKTEAMTSAIKTEVSQTFVKHEETPFIAVQTSETFAESSRTFEQPPQPIVQSQQPIVQSLQPIVQSPQPIVQSLQPFVQSPHPLVQSIKTHAQSPIPFVHSPSPIVQNTRNQESTSAFPVQFNANTTNTKIMPRGDVKDECITITDEDVPMTNITPGTSHEDPEPGTSKPGTPQPDPAKDTYTLTTSSGQKIDVPTIITSGYDFENLLCLFCEKQPFKNDKTLINHLLNHFGVAPKMATCPICGLSLQKKSFARHVRLHGDVQPEVCPYCKKEFREKRSLDKHVRAIHEAERPFPCDQCSEAFRNTVELKAHMNRHLKDHPFKCDVCSLSFQKQEALTTHYRLHTGERPFACNICDKTFNSEKNRRIHILRHEGSLPHKCEVCDMTFQSKSHLIKHEVIHNKKSQVTVAKINTFLESFGASLGEFGLDDDYDSNDQISLHPATENGEIEDESVKLSPCFTKTKTLDAGTADSAISFDLAGNDLSNDSILIDDLDDARRPSSSFSSPSIPSLVKGLTEEEAEKMARAELSGEIAPTHDGTHLCVMCNTRLGNKRSYIIHLRRHAGMLNFKCNYCPKTFQGRVKLNRHMNTHFRDGVTPLSSAMIKPETSQTQPTRPVVAAASESPPLPLLGCTQCGKSYSDKTSLQEHTKMHLIEDAKAKFSTATKEKKVNVVNVILI